MIEKPTSHRARAEWPNPISPQRVRKRPQQQSSHSQRRYYSPSASPPESSHSYSHSPSSTLSSRSRSSSLRHNPSYHIRLDTRLDRLDNFDYFEYQAAINTSPSSSSIIGHVAGVTTAGDGALNLTAPHTSLPDTSWMANFSTGPMNTIPLSPDDAVSPGYSTYIGTNGGASLSLQTGAMPGLSMPWDIVNSTTHLTGPSDFEDICMSEANVRSYGSHGSMELASASAVSATSDTYVFPFGSPGGASPLLDLEIPSPSVAPLLEAPNLLPRGRYIRSQNPWNPHDANGNVFNENSNANCVGYEPEPAPLNSYEHERSPLPYETSSPVDNERLIVAGHGQQSHDVYGPEAPRPNWFDESDTSTSYSNTLYTPSHGSPVSQHSPQSHGSQAPLSPDEANIHSHVFSAFPEPQKNKVTRGRVRPLTEKEKREARDVRQAGACWACHLSKIKCSPCSPGFPCEQCTRLSGKRRFCLLPCFNDPVEMLDKFLVPESHIRMYTTENTKKFISRNADAWGTDEMIVRLSWGYRVPLKVTVVSLSVRGSSSIFRYQHQTYINASGKATYTKKKSPPLGIPLMLMEETQEEYARYIKKIVQHDLEEYARIAYEPEESDIAKRLLKTVCQFYIAGVEANDEYELLREAIEIHIACAILERSLILDGESTNLVEGRLREDFPPESSPRFLREWGQMMWTSNRATTNERKWAIGFSVLLVLTLVMDKTLGLSYFNTESRIRHGGKEAIIERHEFQERVKVTQTNLFERCKEILHSKFKTRKGGKESFNPIRDGDGAWRGKVIDERIAGFVHDVKNVVRDHEPQVRSCRVKVSKILRDDPLSLSLKANESPYTDAARLACVFLDDFLEH
ncbi:fungal zn binuclear cluster domain containing protein [Botrytis cinerea]